MSALSSDHDRGAKAQLEYQNLFRRLLINATKDQPKDILITIFGHQDIPPKSPGTDAELNPERISYIKDTVERIIHLYTNPITKYRNDLNCVVTLPEEPADHKDILWQLITTVAFYYECEGFVREHYCSKDDQASFLYRRYLSRHKFDDVLYVDTLAWLINVVFPRGEQEGGELGEEYILIPPSTPGKFGGKYEYSLIPPSTPEKSGEKNDEEVIQQAKDMILSRCYLLSTVHFHWIILKQNEEVLE